MGQDRLESSGLGAQPPLDRVRVTGVEVRATHGVYAEEKTTPQLFIIDLDCRLNRRPDVDRLDSTLDYAELVRRVVAVVSGPSVDLIETLAERVGETCLADPRIAEVEVTVHKPQAPLAAPAADVAVTITRRRAK